MPNIPSFDEYVNNLGYLTPHVDPTELSPQAISWKEAAESLAVMPEITVESLTQWIAENPGWVPALGLAVGLGQEKLKNALKNRFDTSGWVKLAQQSPADLISWLDSDFEVVRLVEQQRNQVYNFGDLLVARGGGRAIAKRAGTSGRLIEDKIEAVAIELGLPYKTRTRFVGRNNRTGPCDLVLPSGESAAIVVAAKGFDSTGSKLTDAVREIEEIAEVRHASQFVMAVIDGVGWKSRIADLRRIYDLWSRGQIDGMYTLATLDEFRADLRECARLKGLFPSTE